MVVLQVSHFSLEDLTKVAPRGQHGASPAAILGAMSIHQDELGRWHYQRRIHLPNDRRIRIKGSPSVNTERAAEAAERAHIERAETEALALMRGFVAVPTGDSPTTNTKSASTSTAPLVRDFIKRFVVEYAPDGKHGGTRTRNIHLNGAIRRHFGHLRLDEIDQSHVNGFIAINRTAASQTVKNKLNALSVMLGYAADLNIIQRHTLKMSVKLKQRVAIEKRALSRAEVASLIAAASKRPNDHRYVVAMLLASEAGLRIGEIRGLQWTDIKDGVVTVRRSYDDREQLSAPKNGKPRAIPVSPALAAAFAELAKAPKRAIWILSALEPGKRGRNVIHVRDGHLAYTTVIKAMKRYYRDAKLEITEDVDPWHALRHTFGTELAGSNVPLPVVQRLMGHSDIRTTMRYVTTTAQQASAAIAQAFGTPKRAVAKRTTG